MGDDVEAEEVENVTGAMDAMTVQEEKVIEVRSTRDRCPVRTL